MKENNLGLTTVSAAMLFVGVLGVFIFTSAKKEGFDDTYLTKPIAIEKDTLIYTDGFDFPVGGKTLRGYYNAQKFTENEHLGEDWNGVGGGNTDLGDPIYSVANGYVTFSENIGSGWGNIIRITHYITKDKAVESFYAHCDTILVKEGDVVKKGQKIGTIGTAGGSYLAHLHFELRDDLSLDIGGGYSFNTQGYINPTEFIKNNR